MNILSIPPTDVLTRSAIEKLVNELPETVDVFYLWSCVTEIWQVIPEKKFNIVVIKDTLGGDYVSGQMPYADQVIEFLNKHQDLKFILVLAMENIAHVFAQCSNVKIVRMGGCILNELELYQQLTPVRNKNFNSTKTILSLNRNPRFHRMLNISYLHGTGLSENATITYLHQALRNHDSILDVVPWDFGTVPDSKRALILDGFIKFKSQPPASDDYDIYRDIGVVNTLVNFETKLRPYYENSFVEIVAETTFAEPAFLVTEKTTQVFLGFNFPILLSGPGAVQFLRDIGFDMFDDIIDHSYDTELDSVKRVVMAIDLNYEILHNGDLAKQKWQQCQDRFAKNWNLIQSGQLAQWYTERLKQEFLAALAS
jgi:hypothetical protein